MIVKITQEHINKGQIGSSRSCPIALALKDTFKVKFAQATQGCLTVGQFPENLVFTISTPPKIMDFIESFDSELAVEPFEFELSLEGVKL